MAIGIKFPFEETENGGVIKPTLTTVDTLKSNLVAFLTLRKGQRPMNNRLYSPLYDYVFETFDQITENELMEALEEKVAEFFPMLKLEELLLEFVEEKNLLKIKIIYSIPSLGGINDSISIDFQNTNNNPQ